MRVLLAFDKFKDAITAREACDTATRALRGVQRDWTIDICPLTDGGDGFESILRAAVSAQRVDLKVTGPRGGLVDAGLSLAKFGQFPEAVRASWFADLGLSPESQIAIVEMARASGIGLLSPELRNPWETTTYGTGQLIRAAAELGANAILLGVGGSATNDVGTGALAALGVEFRGANGEKFRPPLPRQGKAITQLDGDVYASIPPIIIATDVTNPLFGPRGATATYGPQKGLGPEGIPEMEASVHHAATLLCNHWKKPLELADHPGSGAAGGIAFGLVCAAGAKIVPGFAFTSACLDLHRRIAEADIVVTGEGRFDASSFSGKGPGNIVVAARERGKPVHVFAGLIAVHAEMGVEVHALSAGGPVNSATLQATRGNLAAAIQRAFGGKPAI